MQPLKILGPVESFLAYALVDTGADETMCPMQVASMLGVVIEPEMQTTIFGIDGSAMSVAYASVDLEIGNKELPSLRWSSFVGFHNGNN